MVRALWPSFAFPSLIMGPQMAIGGTLETAATFVFGVLFLFALGRGSGAIRARRIAEHRRWMIRASPSASA